MKDHQRLVSGWLESIGNENGGTLVLDADGHCVIPLIEEFNFVVDVPANTEEKVIFIYLSLLKLPNEIKARLVLVSRALELNLFGLLGGGYQIALDSRSDQIVLSFSVPIPMIDDGDFRRILSAMLKCATDVRQRLQGSVGNLMPQLPMTENNGPVASDMPTEVHTEAEAILLDVKRILH